MNDNRFAPPEAAVADVRSAPEEPPPAKVVLGVRLLWAAWLASVALVYVHRDHRPTDAVAAVALALEVLFVAFLGYLTFSVGRGRNWARITTLILVVLGFASLAIVPNPLGRTLAEQFLNGLGAVCDVVALALLFAPTASAWFKRRTA